MKGSKKDNDEKSNEKPSDSKEAKIASRKNELEQQQRKLASTATTQESELSNDKNNDNKQAIKENDEMQQEQQKEKARTAKRINKAVYSFIPSSEYSTMNDSMN